MKNNEQIEKILEQLETGVEEIFRSDNYTNYLKVMARFHQYSINNSILIYLQNPDATYVAGYHAWQKNFHRTVKRKEKGIRIISPLRRKKMYPIIIDGEIIEDEEPEIIGYRISYVFDVSQTVGEDLPNYISDILPGEVHDYRGFRKALTLVSPVPIRFETIKSEAHGYYQSTDKEIIIDNTMSETQTIKTMIHEISHALLHDQKNNETRNTKEVQAESIAYCVCSHYGINTEEYSFPYIAGWSSSLETEELKDSLSLIRETTHRIISLIDEVRNNS